jgi:hypothetical protein
VLLGAGGAAEVDLIGNGIATVTIAEFFDRLKARAVFLVQDTALSLHRRGTP